VKNSSGNKKGGGPGSKVVVNKPIKYGTPARGVSPAGVNQLGTQRSNHATENSAILRKDVTPVYGGTPAPTNSNQELGNQNATRGIGVGGGRTVQRSGSQAQHGPVAGSPKPAGRDILSSYGPDSPNVRGRR
jgi:hypothetical protein